MSKRNSTGIVPAQRPAEPLGDRGHGDTTWTPGPGEQGISNRVGDEDPGAATDAGSFGHDRDSIVAMADEDPAADSDEDDEEDDEEEDEDDDDFDDDAEEDVDDDEEGEDTDDLKARPS